MPWKFDMVQKSIPKLNKPILIEGLPGIGNVGKIAADFITDKLKAKKLYEISSYTFPHSVFVNENNLVELPKIEIYYKRFNDDRNDLLILAGDVQPIDEVSSYEFSEKMLDIAQKLKVKEIITMGGIGLNEIHEPPIVYCTGNSKDMIARYKKNTALNNKIYGIVGPIVGVTGLLLGLAKKRNLPAMALLAETIGHPMYLGIKPGKETLKILNKKLQLKLNLKDLDKEIKELEEELMKKTKELSDVSQNTAIKKMQSKHHSYIG